MLIFGKACGGSRKKGHPRKDLDLKILSQRYRFTDSELILYKQRFERIARGLGFTIEDFRENMGLLGMKSTRLIADRIFAVMNKSKSGIVTLEEYLSYTNILMNGTKPEKAQQSFKLIKNAGEGNITYSEFSSWIINVWKMYNTLTGIEVSATQEDIRYYFDLLDLKKDNEIDLEEYTESMGKNENLFEWFDFVNKRITDKINPPNVDQKRLENMSYKESIENIENDIKDCLSVINGLDDEKADITKMRAYSQSGINFPFRRGSTFSNYSSQKYEVNDNSTSETDINIGNAKVPKILLSEFSDEENDENEKNEKKLEKLKEKLVNLLEKIKIFKDTDLSNTHSRVKEDDLVLSNLEVKNVHRKDSAIHWGDHDWNLVLNMMLGIQKAVKASAVNLDPTADVTKEEFKEKSKHNVLPGKENQNRKVYKFRDYAPMIFERIRRFYGISASEYTKSLGVEKIMQSLMVNEFSSLEGQCSSGKSGSFFYFSDDGKYILKTLKREEYLFLRKILPDYYFHVMKNPHTLITRFFGFHKLIVSVGHMLYFVVMGNVFKSGHNLQEVFDLKGSTYGRSTNPNADKSVARKDLDFLQLNKKIIIGKDRKRLLIQQIERDSELMISLNIIDYSLLLGIHEVQNNSDIINKLVNHSDFIPFAERDNGGVISSDGKTLYFMGIIDILTHYGSKKKVEHMLKAALHDKKAVSCAPPGFYAQRFITFLDSLLE